MNHPEGAPADRSEHVETLIDDNQESAPVEALIEPLPVDPLDLGEYEEVLLQMGRMDKVDAIHELLSVLHTGEVLHRETWHNLKLLKGYIPGNAFDPLVDKAVEVARDATKTQYQLQVQETLKTLNEIVSSDSYKYGVRTADGIDALWDFSAVYDEKTDAATLRVTTESGETHGAIDRRRLVVNVEMEFNPAIKEAIDRFRSGDPV